MGNAAPSSPLAGFVVTRASVNSDGIEGNDRLECNIGGRIEYGPHAEIYGALPQLLQALVTGDVVQRESDPRMLRGKSLNRSR